MGAFNFGMPATGTMATTPGGSNLNPTGANAFGGATASWGSFAPPTGSPGNYGYGASANPNPTSVYGSNFSFPASSTNPYSSFGAPTTSMSPGTSPGAGYAPLTGNLGKGSGNLSQLSNPLGSGLGPQVQQFLNENAGYNAPLTQQAVNAQIQAMQSQIQQGYGNLESGMGAAGISPNSSTAALETSNYMSNAVAQENAMTAQEYFNMWNTSMGNETSMLESVITPSAQRQQQQYVSPMQIAGTVIGAVGTAAML